jgi:hypothetical protein
MAQERGTDSDSGLHELHWLLPRRLGPFVHP